MNICYLDRLKVRFNIKIIITYRNMYLKFVSERLFLDIL